MKYCCFCGNVLIRKMLLDRSHEKYCQTCDRVFFDSPLPAIIVAVMNNDQIILTRSIEWTHQYWGLIAGHIRSGETAEEAALGLLARAAMRAYCTEHAIAHQLVGSKQDMRTFVRGIVRGEQPPPPSPLAHGWRGRTVGAVVRDVLAGRATVGVASRPHGPAVVVR